MGICSSLLISSLLISAVADESIADAKVPLRLTWFADSYIDIPIHR
jgi:hypothetical protein